MGDPPPPPPDRKRPSEADGSDDPPPAAKKSRKEGGSGDAPAPAAPPKPIASLAALDKARRALQLQAALKAKMAGLPPVSERWERQLFFFSLNGPAAQQNSPHTHTCFLFTGRPPYRPTLSRQRGHRQSGGRRGGLGGGPAAAWWRGERRCAGVDGCCSCRAAGAPGPPATPGPG